MSDSKQKWWLIKYCCLDLRCFVAHSFIFMSAFLLKGRGGSSARRNRNDEATVSLNSCHSTSTYAVHSGRSWNNQDTSFLNLYRAGPPTLFGKISWSCTFVWPLVAYSAESCRSPGSDRSTVLHQFWHERPTLNGTTQPKLCRNQWVTVDTRSLCNR